MLITLESHKISSCLSNLNLKRAQSLCRRLIFQKTKQTTTEILRPDTMTLSMPCSSNSWLCNNLINLQQILVSRCRVWCLCPVLLHTKLAECWVYLLKLETNCPSKTSLELFFMLKSYLVSAYYSITCNCRAMQAFKMNKQSLCLCW